MKSLFWTLMHVRLTALRLAVIKLDKCLPRPVLCCSKGSAHSQDRRIHGKSLAISELWSEPNHPTVLERGHRIVTSLPFRSMIKVITGVCPEMGFTLYPSNSRSYAENAYKPFGLGVPNFHTNPHVTLS